MINNTNRCRLAQIVEGQFALGEGHPHTIVFEADGHDRTAWGHQPCDLSSSPVTALVRQPRRWIRHPHPHHLRH